MRTRLLLGTRLNKLFVLILKATERLIFDKTKKTLSYQKNVYSSQGFGKTILWYQERVGRGDLRIVATSKIDGKDSEWCCLFRKNQETKTLKPKQFSLAVGEVRSRSIIKRKWLCSGDAWAWKAVGCTCWPPWPRQVSVFWEHVSWPHLGANRKNTFPSQHKPCLQCCHPELHVPLNKCR